MPEYKTTEEENLKGRIKYFRGLIRKFYNTQIKSKDKHHLTKELLHFKKEIEQFVLKENNE